MHDKHEKEVEEYYQPFLYSNALIKKVGKTTAIGEKVFTFAMTVLENRQDFPHDEDNMPIDPYYRDLYTKIGSDFSEGIVADIKMVDLRNALNSKSGSFYSTISELMDGARFRRMFEVIYRDKNISGSTALITGTAYDSERGRIFIKFNNDVANLIYKVKKDATLTYPRYIYDMDSIYGIRIYNLLRHRLTYEQAMEDRRREPHGREYVFTYDLPELKFMLSAIGVNSEDPSKEVQVVVSEIKNGAFEQAEKDLPEKEKKMTRYADLQRYTLEKGFREINGFKDPGVEKVSKMSEEEFYGLIRENAQKDIHFRYEPVRNGRGGKVVAVRLKVGWNRDIPGWGLSDEDAVVTNAQDAPDSLDRLALADEIADIIPVPLRPRQYMSILDAACNDIEKVRRAVKVLKSKEDVNDTVGFLISAIKGGWEESAPYKGDRRKQKSSGFNNFEEHQYDFDAIEKAILNASVK